MNMKSDEEKSISASSKYGEEDPDHTQVGNKNLSRIRNIGEMQQTSGKKEDKSILENVIPIKRFKVMTAEYMCMFILPGQVSVMVQKSEIITNTSL